MPWFTDPVDFLADVDEIRRESQSLDDLTDSEDLARLFRQARGSAGPDPVELPWLDVDLAVLIAVCRYAGDDVAIALDYRTSIADPRVVASDIWTDPHQYAWRTVAATFSAFTGALGLAGPRRYGYVGPAEILQQVQAGRHGEAITSHHDLAIWLAQQAAQDREEPFTFVIDLTGTLRLAPQRSEHVICAGGEAVLSAGEITFTQDRDRWVVSEISNQSTGYCPDVSSWQAVAAALGRAGLDHPTAFSHPITFRRCPQCHQRNIVKDDHYVCAVCETPLPDYWNMDEPARDTEA
ncbi:hypothetical protein [Actinomadura madurae]|uniref:hypothetical protein n=2 Tax=Actinomadura TaxID=1988 RepID=UPI0003AD6BDE